MSMFLDKTNTAVDLYQYFDIHGKKRTNSVSAMCERMSINPGSTPRCCLAGLNRGGYRQVGYGGCEGQRSHNFHTPMHAQTLGPLWWQRSDEANGESTRPSRIALVEIWSSRIALEKYGYPGLHLENMATLDCTCKIWPSRIASPLHLVLTLRFLTLVYL